MYLGIGTLLIFYLNKFPFAFCIVFLMKNMRKMVRKIRNCLFFVGTTRWNNGTAVINFLLLGFVLFLPLDIQMIFISSTIPTLYGYCIHTALYSVNCTVYTIICIIKVYLRLPLYIQQVGVGNKRKKKDDR